MPASPATPRRSSKNRRSAPVTPVRHDALSSKPLGLSDTNSVKDRIRQWQEQGAKVVSTPVTGDILDVGDENAGAGAPCSASPGAREVTRDADTTPRRKTGRWVDPDNKEWIREARRSSSTPRKRVISDEHWKKKKQQQKEKPSPRSGGSTPRQETRKEKRSSEVLKHSSSRIEREERRQRRKHARSSTESGAVRDAVAETKLENTSTSPRPRLGNEESTFQADPDSGVDDDLPRRLQDRHPSTQPTKERRKSLRSPSRTEEKLVQRSQYAAMLDKPPTTAQQFLGVPTGSIRSGKDGIGNDDKEMLARTEPVHPTSQRLPSIEAWLEEQPDPFIEGDPGPVLIPAPLKTRASKPKLEVSQKAVQDPNKIWNYVESASHKPDRVTSLGRRRRKKTRRSPDAAGPRSPDSTDTVRVSEETLRVSSRSQDNDQDPKELVSNGLKRRGARALRSRTGSSPVKQTTPDYEPGQESVTTPIIEAEVPPSRQNPSRQVQPRHTRPCPPTGMHRLSTIASVETFRSQAEAEDGASMQPRDSNGLQRRLTTHEDLMSVLSLPGAGGSIKSARSVRTAKSCMSVATLGEVFEELEVDEAKYMRELKTLVDGVIPVLLQCVLSKSDSAAAAGLFSSSGSARDDLNFTRPIVDMGVALERLKTLHKRIPTSNLNSLFAWAQSAHKVYIEYLKAWRLGFQDVIVNLAPPNEDTNAEIDEGMARDENGDVVNSDGKKVDVAYLLKRPLVRIKKLAKVFARLKVLKPSSKSSTVAEQYDDLIKTARMRSHEEQSRLEDEAAANVDATKARDVRTLAVLSGIKINKSRRVKARDCFSLTFYHSSGQRLDCEIELFLREDQPGVSEGGDLLICEIENNGIWLLFPPLESGSISARHGDNQGEIVIMVRGLASYGQEWHELLLLNTSDIETATEWVNMLATQPVPPKLNRSSSFTNGQNKDILPLSQARTTGEKRLPLIPQYATAKGVEIPIGESVVGSDEDIRPSTAPSVYQHDQVFPIRSENVPYKHSLLQTPLNKEAKALPMIPNLAYEDEQVTSPNAPSSDTSSPGLRRAKVARKRPTLRGESASSTPLVPSSPILPSQLASGTGTRKISRTDDASREWMTLQHGQRSASPDREENITPDISQCGPDAKSNLQPPEYHRAISSTPSMELPTVHRLRPSSPVSTPLTQSIQDKWSAISSAEKKSKQEKSQTKVSIPENKIDSRPSDPGMCSANGIPTPPPHRLRSQAPVVPQFTEAGTIPHSYNSASRPGSAKAVPPLTSQQPSSHKGRHDDRRSSSPLKHEYAPSTTSGSDESDEESVASSGSEISTDGILERGDRATPLVPIQPAEFRRPVRVPPPASLPSLPAGSLAPSNSASQAPYRTVPRVSLQSNASTFKTIATVSSWSNKGFWENLHPDECSVVVSPGLIEAYEMSAAHSGGETKNDGGTVADGSSCAETGDQGIRRLVAFELTPLILLRRGTALDISIRSESITRAKVKTSTNIMFRSRNVEECEALYAMINHARMSNPTWEALTRARSREMSDDTFNTGPGSARHSRFGSRAGSWFGFGGLGRRSSYRASSAPVSRSPSIGGDSETSFGSMSSAFSALRRFSGGATGGKGMFNLNRSSVIRKNRRFGTSASASLYSSSSGTTGTGGSGSGANSPAASQLGLVSPTADQTAAAAPAPAPAPAPIGTINNLKIRLYLRESGAKWRHMGAARLSVMPAPVINNSIADGSAAQTDNDSSPPGTTAGSRPPSTLLVGQPGQSRGPRLPSSNHTPHRVHGNGNEKRIVITGKTKGELLLDATLHESCFERVARTGIAVNVWEEHEEVAKSGGVVGGKGRTYMIQMMGEAEAAWLFGMVGRLRY
ncbi:hypothetical protein GJ744_011037 [Endocarpon pusillum]|uniref:PI-PLC Y-box domain-containing protein n=1 Tax=Endocarpon pusillum TaxID=364733 RepID=A0A8H7E3Q6_9EURO|nr:hypothetical protein GJ744_011037 [Endocarpon pusillum]